ncbi:MAG: transglycosylase domain-containing protein [Clostridiales bacterium]|jgi:penicillin-binding protein 1A|nr:transglycosylase domain-containing protein [Clostridiales bacterium]
MDYSHKENVKRRKRQRNQLPRIKNKISTTVLRVVIAVALIGGFAAAGAGFGIYMGILSNSPTIDIPTIMPEIYTSFIYSADTGEEIDRLYGAENRVNAPFNRIPANLKNAFVAIEDKRFYQHNGVDIEGMARALYNVVKTMGEVTQGASTITQQLIKNKLSKFDNDLISKLQEQYMAVEFEKELSKPENLGSKEAAKDYILGVYMNTVNLGHNYRGVQTAAWNYFGKDVSELTLAECSVIAAITQNPWRFAPDRKGNDNRYRQELVLEEMLAQGYITQEEFDVAWNEDVANHIIQGAYSEDGSGVVHSYFTDILIDIVSRDLQAQYQLTESEAIDWIYNRGLQIFSTQDMGIQKIVDDVFLDPENFPAGDYEIDVVYQLSYQNSVTEKITNYEETKTVKTKEEVDAFVQAVQDEQLTASDKILGENVLLSEQPQASFVITDYHNGQVKAINGGRGPKQVNRSWNRAYDSLRHPGSQFKPLASYAPALDLGIITPATVYDDAPFMYNGYIPNNWYGKNTYEGLATVRKGIYHSMNVLAVRNFVNTGIETGYAYLKNFGFNTLVDGEFRNNQWFTDKVPSAALGGLTDGVRLVELCSAYGAIANMGELHEPIFYTRVLDHEGNILLENNAEPTTVIKKTTAYLLTDMMEDTMGSAGTGPRARFDGMAIAGKTGTSTDSRDLGFTGYTPYYVASVWMGFDHQKFIRDSNSYHLQIWKKIMEAVHKDLPEKRFEQPDGITSASVCRDSGLLATELCEQDPRGGRVYTEIFASGTQPTEYCDVHGECDVCTVSGERASHFCPPETVERRVGIIRREPVNLEINPDANVQDSIYELTPELLQGLQCTYHTLYPQNTLPGLTGQPPSVGDYNWGGTLPGDDPDAIQNLNGWDNFIPANPGANAQPPQAPTPTPPASWPFQQLINPTPTPQANWPYQQLLTPTPVPGSATE